MQPGARVDTITRVATSLEARGDWIQIELILSEFGYPTDETWYGDTSSHVIELLQYGDTDALLALDAYLKGPTRQPEEPWENEHFRLFLTHIATQKQVARDLKSCLAPYGVDAFVAHADIEPGKEWRAVIESALFSCDALAGLLHSGFRESPWCDQEIGIALGRGIPVVPIQFDFAPYGFFGSVQAVNNGDNQTPTTLAHSLVRVLLKQNKTATTLIEAIVLRLCRANSFKQANTLSKLLADEAPPLSRDQAEQLRHAQTHNPELQGAYDFDPHLSSIEAKIPDTASASARRALDRARAS